MSLSNISASVRDITRLIRHDADNGLLPNMLLDQADEFFKARTTAFSQVEDFIWVRTINRANNPIDNVVNVSVVTAARAVSKLLELHSAADAINEFERPVDQQMNKLERKRKQ